MSDPTPAVPGAARTDEAETRPNAGAAFGISLEEYLLPKLRGEVRAIKGVLEEREREDMFRLKKIKGKKDAQKKAQEELASVAE